MKNHIRILFWALAALPLLLAGCRDKRVEAETPDPWDEATVMSMLGSKLWRVENVVRVTSSGSVNLQDDPGFNNQYFGFRNAIFLEFQSGKMVFVSGSPFDHQGKFVESAQTYSLIYRIVNPTYIDYEWDDARNTLVATSYLSGGLLPVEGGHTAVLDKSSIVNYDSYQEEEHAAVPSNVTFKVETDPQTTYLFHLKPVWLYEYDSITQNLRRYVVFP